MTDTGRDIEPEGAPPSEAENELEALYGFSDDLVDDVIHADDRFAQFGNDRIPCLAELLHGRHDSGSVATAGRRVGCLVRLEAG